MNRKNGLNAAYIGRFQIFHNGHFEITKNIVKDDDVGSLVMVIGSAQYSRSNPSPAAPAVLNPFTYDERKNMLLMSLEGELEKPYNIMGVNDAHVCDIWFNQLIAKTKAEVIYTNSKKEIMLFESKGIETRRIHCKDQFHAQIIREMIADDNNWEKYVPKGTARFIKEYGIQNMLADFYSRNKDALMQVHELQRKKGMKEYDPNEKY